MDLEYNSFFPDVPVYRYFTLNHIETLNKYLITDSIFNIPNYISIINNSNQTIFKIKQFKYIVIPCLFFMALLILFGTICRFPVHSPAL